MEKVDDLRKGIGKRIKDLRGKLDLTQEELAERAEIHHSYIGQIERGTKTASIFTLEKLAKALNVPLAYLFAEEKEIAKVKGNYYTRELVSLVKDAATEKKKMIYDVVRQIVKKR